MAETYSTGREPRGDRMAYWLDTVCRQVASVSIDPRHDVVPDASMSCSTVGDLRIRDISGGDHVYTRGARDVRRGDSETVQFGVPLSGASILIQDGREAVLTPGNMVVYDSARPYTLVMNERFRWQVFLLPKSRLRRSDLELASMTAIGLSAHRGTPRLVSHFLRGLAAEATHLEGTNEAAELADNAADLIATMIRSRFGFDWDVTDRDAVLRAQVTATLDQRHSEPGLGPASIAASHGVSVRTLHALFEGTGHTISERIRHARMVAIRRDLADPRMAHRSIGQIAADHGLRNPSAFARTFRAHEGITAREFRARRRRPD